jgi:hypothetical protein
LKRACVSGNGRVKILGDGRSNRHPRSAHQFKNDLPGRWRTRIDVDEIAIARIARMMIDINPHLGPTNRVQSGSEAVVRGGVERDHDVELLGTGRRQGKKFAAGKKTVLLKDAFFVPGADVLAGFF